MFLKAIFPTVFCQVCLKLMNNRWSEKLIWNLQLRWSKKRRDCHLINDTDMYNLPTILCPQSVLRRMICILEVDPPGIPARTLSTLLQTLRTDPLRMWNVRVLKPISHWRPRLAFLQLPLLQETKCFFISQFDHGLMVNNGELYWYVHLPWRRKRLCLHVGGHDQ